MCVYLRGSVAQWVGLRQINKNGILVCDNVILFEHVLFVNGPILEWVRGKMGGVR